MIQTKVMSIVILNRFLIESSSKVVFKLKGLDNKRA